MVTLRKATIKDAEILYEWRKDPLVQQMSHNNSTFTYRDHLEWLQLSLGSKLRHILIAEIENVPIGTGRADYNPSKDEYTLSWSIAKGYRNHGYGKKLVQELLKMFKPSRAEVKDVNVPSLKIARALMKEIDKKDDVFLFTSS